MRIGFNPNKDRLLSKPDFFHQVILPVHIPDQQGYFKDSFEILRFSLESLLKTCHSKTYITVVSNGSCAEVTAYLDKLLTEGKLHEVIHTTSIGKLNAILKGLAGHDFPLITISDADVLFLNGWQKAAYEVFEAFPKAGVVSPVPNSRALRYYTARVILDTLLGKKSSFVKVKESQAMMAFSESIGNPGLFKKVHLDKILAVKSNNTIAAIGAGHFVATYKGVCFEKYAQRFSNYSLGGDSEQLLLDKPASDLGLWRLSTYGNYAFHMGNVKEDWMAVQLQKTVQESAESEAPQLGANTYPGIANTLADFFSRIIFKKPFWQLYLRHKGLSRQEANDY